MYIIKIQDKKQGVTKMLSYDVVKEKVDEVLKRNDWKDESIYEVEYKNKPMAVSFSRGVIIVCRGKETFVGKVYDKTEKRFSCLWKKVI